MAERLRALLTEQLKYASSGVRIPLSPPVPFQEVQFYQQTGPVEKYPSGRRGSPAKGVVCESAARVQIPPSPPPKDSDIDTMSESLFLHLFRLVLQHHTI